MQLHLAGHAPWRLTAGLLLVAGLVVALPRAEHVAAPTISIGPLLTATVSTVASVETPPAVRSLELQLVAEVDGVSYMKLADLDKALPHHGALRLVEQDGDLQVVVGVVRDRDVPAGYRRWGGRKVSVDGTCTATVTGFAVISRIAGGPTGDGARAWDIADVMDNGSKFLAARLDRCSGVYARDAALPPVVRPEVLVDDQLAAAGRAALLASEPARHTQEAWGQAEQHGNWYDHADLITQVLRHPRTGAKWVSVHAHAEHGCGDPELNVWGLFRVLPDGKLATVALRQLELDQIEELVDIDGDGELEIIGRPWLLLDAVVERTSGEELTRLSLPYYGCPC